MVELDLYCTALKNSTDDNISGGFLSHVLFRGFYYQTAPRLKHNTVRGLLTITIKNYYVADAGLRSIKNIQTERHRRKEDNLQGWHLSLTPHTIPHPKSAQKNCSLSGLPRILKYSWKSCGSGIFRPDWDPNLLQVYR